MTLPLISGHPTLRHQPQSIEHPVKRLRLLVLPTGGGKSLLFLAPACLEDPGVSVVRLIAASIPHLEWSSGEELSAPVVLRLSGAPSNSAQSSLTSMPVSLSYSYATALLRA
ncbi:hypothetical protein HBI40_253420 [Parastagonospora nodorum]|nr:hypothetical protein HBI41_258480 [Parastagonospora nodorum]KAH6250892.1 hypothetical protein HBI40_253420 [Parastagonospora nodorum]